MILTGTGPAGGKGIKQVVWVAQLDTLRGLLSRQDPKQFLFFTRTTTASGQARRSSPDSRSAHRSRHGDSVKSYFAQLKACRRWGNEEPHDCQSSVSPYSSPTATTTACCPHRTPSTWAAAPEQRTGHLPRRRPRRNIPVPRAVRHEGSRVPRAVAPRRRWAVTQPAE